MMKRNTLSICLFNLFLFPLLCIGQSFTGTTPISSFRDPTQMNIRIGGGISNGFCLGAQYFILKGIAVEGSVGFIRLLPKNRTSLVDYSTGSNGVVASTAITCFANPEDESSTMVSLLFSFIQATPPVEIYEMRLAFTSSIGYEIHLARDIIGFVRTGPSVHFLFRRGMFSPQLFMHVDGGIGITL